jgi:hypothetical protein
MRPDLEIDVEIIANNPYKEPLLVSNEHGLRVLLQPGDSIRFPFRFNPKEYQITSVLCKTKAGGVFIKCKKFYLVSIDF